MPATLAGPRITSRSAARLEGLDPDRIVRRKAGERRVALPSIQRRAAEREDDRQALPVDGAETGGDVRGLVGRCQRDEILRLVDEEHDPALGRHEPVDCGGERGPIGDKCLRCRAPGRHRERHRRSGAAAALRA